eukprot:CAMPEP_0172498134 /NCGR_PEP_ID=MMETSP1066-20121228/109759_1 /TAXON_ID=671091 /ORGANISM="Coscinodiscus wailesii, Strain CCMP2513" /LENGTH=111 /DNA_ID=CAMNT_0013271289 /DNA_START=79 /DNA_END=414 /DNA_ORIENTATION=+
MSAQFIQRIANYIANELLIKGLSESRTFQRFALKTDKHLTQFKKGGAESINSTLDELHKTATKQAFSTSSSAAARASSSGVTREPQPPLRGVAGFMSAFGKEVRKDLGLGK